MLTKLTRFCGPVFFRPGLSLRRGLMVLAWVMATAVSAQSTQQAGGYAGSGYGSSDGYSSTTTANPNTSASANTGANSNNNNSSSTTNPTVQLRSPASALNAQQRLQRQNANGPQWGQDFQPLRPPYVPGEFEQYVQKQAGELVSIRRLGAELVTDLLDTPAPGADSVAAIPADYLVRPGDEIAVTVWGTVDADLLLTVDRSGRISLPRVGAVAVAGVRHAALSEVISQRVAQTFRNFQLTASLSQARPIRVFVTGYAQRPGSLTLGGLSTVMHALMRAGGPSAAGSFRQIQLRRSGKLQAEFDLYELLLRGERQADVLLQPDDVLHIGPVGAQVALIGSVNHPAIFEIKPGETLDDVLKMAGGFNAVADRSRAAVERLADRASGRVTQVTLANGGAAGQQLDHGDLVRVFSAVNATLPQERQNKRVRVEGEVLRPGDYVLPAGSSLSDAVRAAGGFSAGAYVFGTELTRESVRELQAINYERALRDLEDDLARNNATRRISTAEEATAQTTNAAANTRFMERLRQTKPNGRVVMAITPDATELPAMALEDGDRLVVPPRNSTVGVFGSVFSTGSFVFASGRSVEDYLQLAGGPKRGADQSSIFVIRANGTVVSARQDSGFWTKDSTVSRTTVLPGDTVFVPEEMNKSTFVQDAKDWTQILYQFGLGMAGIMSLGL